MFSGSTVRIVIAALALAVATDAYAARRSLRIDFGAWGPAYAPLGPAGSGDCPAAGGGLATWTNMGFADNSVFYSFWINSGDPMSVADGYCQYATPYSSGLETFEYLNDSTIPEDEPGLRSLVGDNRCGGVTGVRYTFLNASRFTEGVKGAQWAFYFFPGGQTVVALYSQLEIGELGYSPQVIPLFGDYLSVWAGSTEVPDGYFVFQDGEFKGPWDGSSMGGEADPYPAESCPPPPELILENGFEP